MSENPILMTQAEYSRHRNKSPQYIGRLLKAGITSPSAPTTGDQRRTAVIWVRRTLIFGGEADTFRLTPIP